MLIWNNYSCNSPVFSRYSFIQFTCIFQVLIHSIHLYFPGTHSFNSPVFSRYLFIQFTWIFQVLIHSTRKNRLKPKWEIWRMYTIEYPDYCYCLFLLIERPIGKVRICLLNMSIVRTETKKQASYVYIFFQKILLFFFLKFSNLRPRPQNLVNNSLYIFLDSSFKIFIFQIAR